jgi:hypothetical protein
MGGRCFNYPIYDQFNQTKPAYSGAPVRIRPFWTETAVKYNMSQSLMYLTLANHIFRQHTLSLDYDWNGYNYILPFQGELFPDVSMTVRDNYTVLRGLVDKAALVEGYNPDENRLIVIFTHIGGSRGSYGRCVTAPDWLPFVVVDPRSADFSVLAHEIGHACRCAHVKGSIMEACSVYADYRNFHNIHTWELYKSYWCTGPRPTNWWDRSNDIRSPYSWAPFYEPSR